MGLTIKEFIQLLNYINENHSFRKMEGRRIKYIQPVYDTRKMTIHAVAFIDGVHDDIIFSITNENRNKNLKELIYNWLDEDKIYD